MKPEYLRWIQSYFLKANGNVRGKCKDATTKMVKAFPELRVAGGFAHWHTGSRPVRDQHWWCATTDGEIVDPTGRQFIGSVVNVRYEELDLNDPATRAKIPTNRCMECGADCYEHRPACSDECEDALHKAFNGDAG